MTAAANEELPDRRNSDSLLQADTTTVVECPSL